MSGLVRNIYIGDILLANNILFNALIKTGNFYIDPRALSVEIP